MKFQLVSALALASVTLGQLVIQDQPQIILENNNQAAEIESLSLSDYQTIQESLKETLTTPHSNSNSYTSNQVSAEESEAEEDKNHGIVDFSDYTILEILDAAAKKHHDHDHHNQVKELKSKFTWPWKRPTPRAPPSHPSELHLHKLGYLVSKSEFAQKNLAAEGITLLAPSDEALTPPNRRKGGDHHKEKKGGDHHDHKQHREESHLDRVLPHPFHSNDLTAPTAGMTFDGSDDEEKKERINKIIGYILKYHTLGFAATAHELSDYSTVATTLNAGREIDEPLRIRVENVYKFIPYPHPSLKFNFYASKEIGYTIKAKNGIIHLISAPLLPPFSPLNSLFLFPQAFSTLTSGLQKVDLDDVLLPVLSVEEQQASNVDEVMAELMKESGGAFTVFSPTNFAFTRLGIKINAFLHSPFPLSKKVLKYVLSYHLVPDVIFHSDYNTLSDEYKISEEVDVPYHHQEEHHSGFSASWDLPTKMPTPPPMKSWWPSTPSGPTHHEVGEDHHEGGRANVTRYVLPTLLSTSGQNVNATLKVAVYSYRIRDQGPIRRAVVVLPHHKEEYGQSSVENGNDRKEYRGRKCHEKRDGDHSGEGHEGPQPVRVFKADAVARNGAIHVVNTLLRPPYNYNHKKEDMNHGVAQLFAN